MSALSQKKIFLKEILANWKWPRQCNPNYGPISKDSVDWFASFHAFRPEAQRAFEKCNFGLLASLAYPHLSKEHLRIGCDLMMVFFVTDEYTDVAGTERVTEIIDIVKDALHNPFKPRPEGEWVGGEVARQFWANAVNTSTKQFQKHFLECFEDYLDSVIDQARDRDTHHFHTVDSYLTLRRLTIGFVPSQAIIEAPMNLPDEFLTHPAVKKLSDITAELVCINNDILSYNKEQATGDDEHNIITIVMQQEGISDVQAAFDRVCVIHDERLRRFDEALAEFNAIVDVEWQGTTADEARTYIDGMGVWVRANDSWSFETGRYFGDRGKEIQQTRCFYLLPSKRFVGMGPFLLDEQRTAVMEGPQAVQAM